MQVADGTFATSSVRDPFAEFRRGARPSVPVAATHGLTFASSLSAGGIRAGVYSGDMRAGVQFSMTLLRCKFLNKFLDVANRGR